MTFSPKIRQLLVAVSAFLAAMSVGFSVTFPSVLLKQLARNDSAIHLDLDTASWIGSIHGLAGIPSIIMPALMQWKGRKIIYITTCLFSIAGWIIAATATSATSILISECFHGFGSHSLLAVAILSMSEMLSPQLRNVLMPQYVVVQIMCTAFVDIIGWYIQWRTLSLLMSMPIVFAALIACLWTESPFWLAYKGEFDRCAKAFTDLRGGGELARMELDELIAARRENQSLSRDNQTLKTICHKIKCKDFYLPLVHTFLLMCSMYWSGCISSLIFGSQIFERVTNSKDNSAAGSVLFNYALMVVSLINVALRHCSRKKVMVTSIGCSIFSLLLATIVNYCQYATVLSKDSHVCFYFLVVYIFFMYASVPAGFSMPGELMPVKYRGVGGPMFVIFTGVLHSSSIKLLPYLFIYLNVWGTWLIYVLNGLVCCILIWKFVPDTKGKTLQQLEDYYAYGDFDRHRKVDTQTQLLHSNK